jgi:SAM-dependent methyltransferase
MGFAQWLLEQPMVYRAWQAPFAAAKLAPVLAHNDLSRTLRVLDVGCGPGTNSSYFDRAGYLGIDINAQYIRYAKRRFQRDFMVADATSLPNFDVQRFDFILVNSLLHHLDDVVVRRLLEALRALLANGGHVHVLELLTPSSRGVAAWLARADRGQFSRSLDEWQALWGDLFAPAVVEPYALSGFGVPLWHMVYFKGAMV